MGTPRKVLNLPTWWWWMCESHLKIHELRNTHCNCGDAPVVLRPCSINFIISRVAAMRCRRRIFKRTGDRPLSGQWGLCTLSRHYWCCWPRRRRDPPSSWTANRITWNPRASDKTTPEEVLGRTSEALYPYVVGWSSQTTSPIPHGKSIVLKSSELWSIVMFINWQLKPCIKEEYPAIDFPNFSMINLPSCPHYLSFLFTLHHLWWNNSVIMHFSGA